MCSITLLIGNVCVFSDYYGSWDQGGYGRGGMRGRGRGGRMGMVRTLDGWTCSQNTAH